MIAVRVEELRAAHRESSMLADAVASIGHEVLDMLDEVSAERDRLAAEVEQLRTELAAIRGEALAAGGVA